jgi:hypothetical protein
VVWRAIGGKRKDPSLLFSETSTGASLLVHCLRSDHLGAAVVAARHGLDLNQRPGMVGSTYTPLEAMIYSNSSNTQGIGLLMSLGADIRQVRPELTIGYLIDAVCQADDRPILLALRHGLNEAALVAMDPEEGRPALTRVLSAIVRLDCWKRFDAEFEGKRRRDRIMGALIKAGANPSGVGCNPNAQPLDNAIGTRNGLAIATLLHLGAQHKGDILEEITQMGMLEFVPQVKEALVVAATKAAVERSRQAGLDQAHLGEDSAPQGAVKHDSVDVGNERAVAPSRPRSRYDL